MKKTAVLLAALTVFFSFAAMRVQEADPKREA